jgi:hypothetical protein
VSALAVLPLRVTVKVPFPDGSAAEASVAAIVSSLAADTRSRRTTGFVLCRRASATEKRTVSGPGGALAKKTTRSNLPARVAEVIPAPVAAPSRVADKPLRAAIRRERTLPLAPILILTRPPTRSPSRSVAFAVSTHVDRVPTVASRRV